MGWGISDILLPAGIQQAKEEVVIIQKAVGLPANDFDLVVDDLVGIGFSAGISFNKLFSIDISTFVTAAYNGKMTPAACFAYGHGASVIPYPTPYVEIGEAHQWRKINILNYFKKKHLKKNNLHYWHQN